MHANNLKPYIFEITNDLKKCCRAAYSRYKIYLEEEKKKQDNNKTTSEKQIIASEIRGAIPYLITFGHLQNV